MGKCCTYFRLLHISTITARRTIAKRHLDGKNQCGKKAAASFLHFLGLSFHFLLVRLLLSTLCACFPHLAGNGHFGHTKTKSLSSMQWLALCNFRENKAINGQILLKTLSHFFYITKSMR